jgi:hypothetical protein
MTKVIKFASDYRTTEEYREAISRTRELLNEIQSQLHNCVIDIAISGKWKEWSDNMPIGAEFTFTEDMLKDTADNNVNEICNLLDAVIYTTEKISK